MYKVELRVPVISANLRGFTHFPSTVASPTVSYRVPVLTYLGADHCFLVLSPPGTRAEKPHQAGQAFPHPHPRPRYRYLALQKGKTDAGQQPTAYWWLLQCLPERGCSWGCLLKLLVERVEVAADAQRVLLMQRPGYEHQPHCRFCLCRRRTADHLDPEELLDPLEGQFDLPARPIQLENLLHCPTRIQRRYQHDNAKVEEL